LIMTFLSARGGWQWFRGKSAYTWWLAESETAFWSRIIWWWFWLLHQTDDSRYGYEVAAGNLASHDGDGKTSLSNLHSERTWIRYNLGMPLLLKIRTIFALFGSQFVANQIWDKGNELRSFHPTHNW
jgi:hypothetical protein